MGDTINHRSSNTSLAALSQLSHPSCFVCGSTNDGGLALAFYAGQDDTVEATFSCQPVFAGYPGMVHGGIICTLLDGAMTNCLFAHGLVAVTVDMNVRFRHPVAVSRPASVRAWLDSGGSLLHCLGAEIKQDGKVVAAATARFVEKETASWFAKRST